MLEKIFLQILNMSFTASFVIAAVMAVRLLLKKVPRIVSYALWAVVLFRLVCPFSFESSISLLPVKANPIPQELVYQQTPQINIGIPVMNNRINAVLPAPKPGDSMNPLQAWLAAGTFLWLCGIAALLIYSVTSMLLLKRKLHGALCQGKNVYLAKALTSPFVMGLLRPKIYLPANLTEREKQYILLHERTHIKRLDHVIKIVSFAVLCLHWFNPLVWTAFFLCAIDMEMSCDEAVIKRLGSQVKKDYASTLLALTTGRHIIGGSPLAFGEGDTKKRIKNILNYKKPAFWMSISSLLVVIIIGISLITNPQQKQTDNTEVTTTPAKDLWNTRTQHIGNNSTVGQLISLLPVPDGLTYDHFMLHTDTPPYQIDIIYSTSDEIFQTYDAEELQIANPLPKNALLLLALINNADQIQTTLTNGTQETDFIHNREWANKTMGQDIRTYAETPEKLQTLIDFPLPPETTKTPPIVTSYYAGQSSHAFIMLQKSIFQNWVEYDNNGQINPNLTNPKWNYKSFTQYYILDQDMNSISDQELYYGTFTDDNDNSGYIVVSYHGDSLSKIDRTETPYPYDLQANLADITAKLLETDLDPTTAKAARVQIIDTTQDTKREAIRITDAKANQYIYYFDAPPPGV